MESRVHLASNGSLAEVVADIRRATARPDASESTAAILRQIAAMPVPAWCSVPEGVAERLLHCEPGFTIYLLSGTAGVRFPPHEHTIAVSTLVLRGAETNVWYRELDDGAVAPTGRSTSIEGGIGHMESDVIHAVEYPSSPRPYDQREHDRMTVQL